MLKIALVSCHASPLAVAASFDCDHPGLYVAQLGSELGALGCQVDIFTRRDRIEQPQVQYWRPNVRIIHVPAVPPGIAGVGPMAPAPEQFGRFLVGFARRQRGGYDIAHACDLASGGAAWQLRRTLGVPYVVTAQAAPAPEQVQWQWQGGAAAAGLQPQLPGDADRVLVRCRQQRDALQRASGRRPVHIDIVPCGFDPALLWPVRLRARGLLRLSAAEFLALHVGRLGPGHGVDTAIEGVAQLAGRHGVPARLLLVGTAAPDDPGPVPELQRLRDLAQRRAVSVMVAGPQPLAALRHWYSAADACIAGPSHNAGGMAVLGAMACATPVIGAAAAGSAGIVVEGETGYLVAPRDAAALANRLAGLHANPVLARSLGVQGWRRAQRHYTWRSVARRLTAIYAQVLAGVTAELTAESAAELAMEVLSEAPGQLANQVASKAVAIAPMA